MKVAKTTKARIFAIQQEAAECLTRLDQLRARLEEHPGTKRMTRKLEVVISKLGEWQKAA